MYDAYVGTLSRFDNLLQRGFRSWGIICYRNTKSVMFAGIIVLLLCDLGFLNFFFERDTNKSFTINDTVNKVNRAWYEESDHFGRAPRTNVFLLMAANKKDNVLTREYLLKLMDLHDTLVYGYTVFDEDGTEKRFTDICYRPLRTRYTISEAGYLNMTAKCAINSILTLYGFNRTVIQNVPDVTAPLATYPMAVLGNFLTGTTYVNGSIKTATGFLSAYFETSDDDLTHVEEGWESHYIDIMKDYKSNHPELDLAFVAERSLNDEILASVIADIYLYVIGVGVMIFYLAMSLGNMDCITSRPWLAAAGVLIVLASSVSGFGLASAIGVPFYSISMFLLLLMLGVGVDQCYLIVSSLDHTSEKDGLEKRIGDAMATSGLNLLLSVLTSALAFATTVSSLIPAISAFCLYAAFCLLFIFVGFMTLFIPLLIIDEKRILDRRTGLCCCLRFENCAAPPINVDGQMADSWFRKQVRKFYENIVTHKIGASIIIVIFVASVIYAAVLASRLGSDQEYTEFITRDSYVRDYITMSNEQFTDVGELFYVVFKKTSESADISSDEAFNYAKSVAAAVKTTDGVSGDLMLGWLLHYLQFLPLSPYATMLDSNGYPVNSTIFYASLNTFLSQPQFNSYATDIVFDKASAAPKLKTFQFSCRFSVFDTGTEAADAMDRLIKAIDDVSTGNSKLEAFATNGRFSLYDAILYIPSGTYQNLIMSSVAVFVASLILLVNPITGLIMLFCIAMVDIQLLGIMYLMGMTLNTVSSVIVVLGVGFSVDYIIQNARGFMVATGSKKERVVTALVNLGSSVMNGGFTTFLAVMVLAFSKSEVFFIFFRCVFVIVVLGLAAGMLFLPAVLSFIGPKSLVVHKDNETGPALDDERPFQQTNKPAETNM